MTTLVHPSAVVADTAALGDGAEIGPYAVVGADVTIGAGTTVGAHAVIEGLTSVGRECTLGVGVVLGTAPQDVKYADEPTRVEIGDRSVLREYVTVHRGTAAAGVTRVGAGCYLMAYVHVAHDCELGDHVTLANGVQLAGHVLIEEGANIGGLTPVHQFVRVGKWSFVGGGSRVPQDVPPYGRAAGNPLKLYGVNTVGLRRAGMPAERVAALQRAYRLVFNSRLSRHEALTQVGREFAGVEEVEHLIDFVSASQRGVLS